jgi:hypothetical protein
MCGVVPENLIMVLEVEEPLRVSWRLVGYTYGLIFCGALCAMADA